MRMKLINIRSILRLIGIDINRYSIKSSSHARLKKYLSFMEIDLVIDVGANSGQTGNELRQSLGYHKKIHSFEPLSTAYEALEKKAMLDPLWEVHNFALGSNKGNFEINIAKNSQSSSLLTMMQKHSDAAPESVITGSEKVNVMTLDEVFLSIVGKEKNIYLKCDTQGFEIEVLKGGIEALRRICLVGLEMSTVELYKGCPLISDVVTYMYAHGFIMVDVKSGFSDPKTGQMLQCDGLFINAAMAHDKQ